MRKEVEQLRGRAAEGLDLAARLLELNQECKCHLEAGVVVLCPLCREIEELTTLADAIVKTKKGGA